MTPGVDRIARHTIRTTGTPSNLILSLQPVRVGPVRERRLVDAGPQAVAHHDPGGAIEAILEQIAHHSEARQPHPAGFDRTRAGHPVALALLAHLRLNVLQRGKRGNGIDIINRRKIIYDRSVVILIVELGSVVNRLE